MKRLFLKMLPVLVSCVLVSCGGEKKSNDIIVKKPVEVKHNTIQKMGDYAQTRKVEWVGASYTLTVKLAADPSLPHVKEGSQTYYDNKISLTILRKDGSEFFSRTFTKSDFDACIDDSYKEKGALLGIVFDRAEGDYLYFAASVGSPDKTSDEYIPMVLKLSKTGSVSISKDTQLDTGSDVPSNDETSDEEEM
jgi:hypothetical protein